MSGPPRDEELEASEPPRGAEPGSNGPPGAESLVVRLCRGILMAAARVVPFRERSAWREEWLGELWALRRRGVGPVGLARFAAGGARHALWERREEEGAMGGGLWRDVIAAARRLRRSPGFTAVTLLVLGLGIGANTALYSALKAALLESSPYPGAERLVLVDLLMSRDAEGPMDTLVWSYPKFELAREGARSVDPVVGFALRTRTLTGAGDALRVRVEFVSPAYFDLLGVAPAFGRLFHPSEEPPEPGTVVLLSHALWTSRFGADPAVLGRGLSLDGATYQVVGVLPEGFGGLNGEADLWAPMAGITATEGPRRLASPSLHWLRAVGRLRPGVSMEQARADLASLGPVIDATFEAVSPDASHSVTAVPFLRARVNPVTRLAVTAVSAGGFLLLLVACANVAGLFLARAAARRGDIAVRAALGAGRARLLREHLLESLLLAGAGGVLGLVVALAGEGLVVGAVSGALQTSGSRGLQYLDPATLGVDGGVLAAGILLALGTGLVFGLLPARQTIRADLVEDLRAGGRAAIGAGGAGQGARGVLVAGQLALTLILLSGAGLMGASFARLSGVDVGFTADDVLTAQFDRGPGIAPEEARAFEVGLRERLAALPGVRSVAVGPCPPLTGVCEITAVRRVDDGPEEPSGEMDRAVTYAVTHDYFATLGVPMRAGRGFDAALSAADPPVAVVNETAARRFFGGAAVGRRLALTHSLTEARMAEVVGVVSDVRYGSLEEEVLPAVYFSRVQAPSSYGTLFIAADGDAGELLPAVRREVARLDPDLPLLLPARLSDLEGAAMARTRVVLGLLVAFASLALLLSVVGLYGIVSYAVARRTREMGLRLALGAGAGEVIRLVTRGPALLAAAGVVSGVAGALLLNRYVAGLLFGVRPGDPRVLGAAAAVLLLAAAAAAFVPARRATRLDPSRTLSAE